MSHHNDDRVLSLQVRIINGSKAKWIWDYLIYQDDCIDKLGILIESVRDGILPVELEE